MNILVTSSLGKGKGIARTPEVKETKLAKEKNTRIFKDKNLEKNKFN